MRAPRSYRQWCRFCALHDESVRFKLRDGPVDWFFCDVAHAEYWLEYRHKPETYHLLRMPPLDRQKYLQGRTTEQEISRLFPKCEASQSSAH